MKNIITSKQIATGTRLIILAGLLLCIGSTTKAQVLSCNAHFLFQAPPTTNAVYFNSPVNPAGATYAWVFGDGGTDNTANPVHTYAPGNYKACLTVTVLAGPNTVGCTSSFCDSIHITNTTVNCNAAFTMQAGTALNSIHFINSGNITGTTYSWNFGDGGAATTADPTHAYAPGNYKVCLTVKVPGSNGTILCTATSCDSVHITPTTITCNAHFTHQFAPAANGVYFISPANPTGATYAWTFGDGSTGSGANNFHTYAPGNYQACLTVTVQAGTNTTGCTSTFCDSVHVTANVNCSAAFTIQQTSVAGSIHFINSSNPTGTTYSWTFGDGGTATTADPTHTYAPGNYKVCLTVKVPGTNGTVLCTATSCDSVHVPPPVIVNCNAQYTHQHSTGVANTEYFAGPVNPTGTIYSWTFGDGATGSGINAVHTYAPGHYKACLTVTVPSTSPGTIACTATYCDSVHFAQTITCNAHFTRQPGSALNSFYFIGPANPTGTQYLWSFGDGGSATTQSAFHTYAPGHYQVCLTVTIPSSATNMPPLCTATYCDSIHITNTSNCIADFSVQKVAGTVRTYAFTNLSSMSATGFFWHFGDAVTSTAINPVHQYATIGQRQVCLTLFDTAHQCSNTKCINLSVTNIRNPDPNSGNNRIGLSNDLAEAMNVIVYPNPASNKVIVHIENSKSPVVFMMYDSTGKLAERKADLGDGDYEINNSSRPSGIYYYQVISDESGVTNGKLIIQK